MSTNTLKGYLKDYGFLFMGYGAGKDNGSIIGCGAALLLISLLIEAGREESLDKD